MWPMIGFTKTGEISQLWYSLLLTACQHNIADHRRVCASLSGRPAAWFFSPFLTFLRWQLGLDNLEMPWACPPPSPWLIRLWVCPSQEPRRRGGDWELWIRETFHGVVNNKVDKVVQNYSRMKSKYGLLPDNILYNDYISCFAVGCSRWLPAPGARLLPASCWTNADKSMN